MDKEKFEALYYKYVQNKCTAEELKQFLEEFSVIDDKEKEEIWFRLFNTTWQGLHVYPGQFNLPVQSSRNKEKRNLSVVSLRHWKPYLTAAAVILAIITTAVLWFGSRKGLPVATKPPVDQRLSNDLPPGSDRAILTLADGRRVVLDSTSGRVVTEHGITVVNLAGQLSYEDEDGLSPDSYRDDVSSLTYHTVSTPRGGQYQLILEDGTKVWLNAASSLRFPTAFTGKNRIVELTGEGYFEVAHNKAKPFSVKVGELDVQVLGTHFNINSYEDEPAIRTTLLEGSVKVMVASSPRTTYQSQELKPGEQAILTDNLRLTIDDNIDPDAVMAWKNGKFQFKDANIETVMRQLSRWYNVEVVYETRPTKLFRGGMPRNISAASAFRILEETGGVHFAIQGRKVIVRK